MSQVFFRKSQNVHERHFGDKLFLLKSGSKQLIQLNETAIFVWQCFNDQLSIEQVSLKLCEKYSISDDLALRDANKIINEFLSEKLIEKIA